ncbi:MAG: hypothetical protein ABIL09_15515 [Gemmatimonadota bacterium]
MRLPAAALLLAGAVAGPAVTSTLAAEPPPVTALRLDAPLALDGRLDEATWQAGAWSTGFHVLNRPGEMAAAQTRFKVRFDDGRLYIGAVADEPHPDQLRLEVQDRDGPVSRDDCLEFMVDATGERVEYYHFIVNPLGTVYDAQLRQGGHVRTAEWASTAAAGAAVGVDQWSVELAIPLVELGLTPASTGDWAIDVTRERRAGAEELSTYAPMSGSFHQARLYARLRLQGAGLSRYLWQLDYPEEQHLLPDAGGQVVYTARTRVANGTGQARAFQYRAVLGGVAGPWRRDELAPDASRDLEFAVPGAPSGTHMLQLQLADTADPQALLAARQVEVTAEYHPLRVDVVRPFYRNSIYATEQVDEIVLDVTSDVPESQLRDLRLHAVLLPADSDIEVTASASVPGLPAATLRLPAAELEVGDYHLEVTLQDRATGEVRHRAVESIRKLPPVPDEWRLDAQLVLRHNDRPVLPFGWFSMPPEAMADTGHAYNLIQSYSGYWQSVEQIRTFLDQAVAAGTAATLYPYPYPEFVNPASIWGKPLTEKEAVDLRARVRALKDHPGLFAWYMADEPELRPALPERCRQIYQIVRDEDPYHPCIMLNDTEAGIVRYRGGGDVLMPDPYPLFIRGGLAAQPLEKVGRFMRTAREAGGGRQAVWITPQGFNYGDYGQENNRGPRLLELRNMTYQAAAYGAHGFLWYTYSQVANYPDLDIGMRWLSREVADLAPYLLAPDDEDLEVQVQAPQPEHVHVAVRRQGAHLLVIAVSTATEPQDVSLALSPAPVGRTFNVVSESRQIAAEGGVLRDRFGVYETHLYTTDPGLAGRPDIAGPTAAIARADATRRKRGNLAFESSGVQVAVSSEAQYGSTPARVVDGVTGGMRWRDRTPGEYPDWLTLQWPAPVNVGRVVVYSGTIADAQVQVPGEGGAWQTVGQAAGASADPVEIRLAQPASTTSLRLLVTAGRPDQSDTQVTEVEVYAP